MLKPTLQLCLSLVASLQAVGQPPARVEACDLFRDLPAFNGKMIVVTGAIEVLPGSREEGPWLLAPDCPVKIRVKGLEYDNTINLTSSRVPPPLVDHKVNFEWDRASDVELAALLGRMDPKTEDVHATVTGLFETRVPTGALVIITPARPDGARTGYGHLNSHPAQIIVRTVTNMYIEKKPQTELRAK